LICPSCSRHFLAANGFRCPHRSENAHPADGRVAGVVEIEVGIVHRREAGADPVAEARGAEHLREALRLLREETPGLIGLSPPGQPGPERPGVIYHPMTCHSGGSLEIYIEPVLPRPQLLLVGEAPLVSALEALGRLQGFTIAVASAGREEAARGGRRATFL